MIVRIVSAIGGGVTDIDVAENTTIGELKRMVARERRIPASTILLVFRGQQLQDNDSLIDCGVGDYDKLYLITRTEGG